MIIGGASLNQTPLNWTGNLENIKTAISDAKEAGIELLCLPELCIPGYGCEDMFLHPWISEKAQEYLTDLIPLTQGIGVLLGLPLHYEGKVYNIAAFVNDGELQGFYVKQHLPKDGVHYEFRWFDAWESNRIADFVFFEKTYPLGHITFDFKGLKVAVEICEDAWVENRPARHLADKVDIILNPSASHFAFNKVSRRHEVIRAGSEMFDCVYVYANQVGNEAGRVIYDGDVIIAQKGKLLATAKRLSFKNVSMLSTTIDFDNTEKSEVNLYDQITEKNEEFPQAVGLALFDYLRKSNNKGFVLSLSGGADSSTVAILISEMVRRGSNELGWEGFVKKLGIGLYSKQDLMKALLTTAYQGTENSSEATLEGARELSAFIGATFHHWEIDDEVETYQSKIEKSIGRKLTWEKDDIALQNIQARARSPIIWLLANVKNALLIATSNRSESAVGYSTMDGDTSGGISPIAGVDKVFIREWLKYAENELGYSALSYVNNLDPSAELRPQAQTQTDEDDLMPYEVLQRIETLFVKDQLSSNQIYDRLKSDYPEEQLTRWIEKFFHLWKRNQWKRERLAPSFHLDAYNLDPRSGFRYPILSGN